MELSESKRKIIIGIKISFIITAIENFILLCRGIAVDDLRYVIGSMFGLAVLSIGWFAVPILVKHYKP